MGYLKWRLSLRGSVLFPITTITVLLSLVLVGVCYWAAHRAVEIMSGRLTRQMTQGVAMHVGMMMDDPAKLLQRAVKAIRGKRLYLGDPRTLARELYAILGDDPAVDWLYFANPEGGIVSIGRLGNGRHVILTTDGFRPGILREYNASPDGDASDLRKSSRHFDAREKTWYQVAKQTGKLYWTEPYLGSAEPILGISSALPVFDQANNFAGICGVDLILSRMSDFMNSLRMGKNGRAFLLDVNGYLIASSGKVAPTVMGADGHEDRLPARDAMDPVVRAAARYLDLHPQAVRDAVGGSGLQSYSFADPRMGDMYVAIQAFHLQGARPWLVVSALPASEYTDSLSKAAYLALALAVCAVALSLIIGSWAVGRALKPMEGLTKVARVVGGGVWPTVPETNRKDEIGVLARGLASMIDRIHQLVGKLNEEAEARTRALRAEAIARTDAERANMSKSKFLAAASHDLRQPMQALFLFTSILASSDLPPRQRAVIGHLERTLTTMRSLLDALLDISKLDARLVTPQVRDVPIGEVLREVEPFSIQAEERALSFRIVSSAAIVRTDPLMLGRILRNLAANALRYTATGGILVGCRRRNGCLRIEVRDTGIGIPWERQEEIFEEFVQLHNAARDAEKGLGLGLAIVKGLGEILGHRIGVRSQPGKGSVFWVDVPFVGVAATRAASAATIGEASAPDQAISGVMPQGRG